jgi:hypothetical protein
MYVVLPCTARCGVYNIVTVNPDAVNIPHCTPFVPCFVHLVTITCCATMMFRTVFSILNVSVAYNSEEIKLVVCKLYV